MQIENLYQIFIKSSGVSTDTRTLKPSDLFFALKGPNFNGNIYAAQAIEKGASFVVIDEEKYKVSEQYILVNDVLKTLQNLANYHRKQLNIPFLGITGSNGKTTTKELLFSVLSKKYITFATKGNLNNHIGVPLTLLSITQNIEFAIIELGANHIGELAELCLICEPTHGMITNIGLDHLEGYGSIEGVALGNSELYFWLLKNEGKVFVNAQDEWLMRMAARIPNPILYNEKSNPNTAQKISTGLFLEIEANKTQVKTNLTGDYNLDNINTALTVGLYFGIDLKSGLDAVAKYMPTNNRSQVLKKDTNEIILDCYNANPSSMMKSIDSFVEIKSDNKVVMLGDMFELGEHAEKEHYNLINYVKNKTLIKAYFFGNEFMRFKNMFPEFHFYPKREDFNTITFKNSLILIKGSRGMQMEKLVEVI